MLIDATGLPRETVLRAEYCVIGSGMGGAAVAHGLARAGRDVLLVEAGDERRTDERSAPVNADHVGRSFKLPLTRCIELGGTSNQWHGICGTLDEADFDHRPWIADSGWPIRRSDLEPFYAAAFALVGLPDGAPLDAAVDGGPAPAGASAARVSRRLADLPLDEGLAGPKIVQYRRSPFRWKPTLLGMARRGALTCLTNAPVLELIPDADGRTVIEALAGAGSDTIRIRARVFVVCCGALETPRLLLNSRARAAAGIGNAQGQVGRRLMDHPVGHVGKLRFLPKVDAPLYGGLRVGDRWVMAGLRLSPEQQRLHATGNHYT
ncbi:MAG TPA: GMC family oxidoreductase N-terminal domain-containing protein [Burkholderiaceae bacterium]|nr:GMC family oxidoreductase N-terminal domain-containing protein [Burkholderiaceae bacterium]